MDLVSKSQIEKQAWKFYCAPLLWLGFLLVLPAIYHAHKVLGMLAMIFPGAYLFSWLGFLMHETWHKYVSAVPNGVLYNLFALLLVSDPQIYKMVHGQHHAAVHTWQDMEFHPLGEIRGRALRILNNLLEIFIGIAYLVIASSVTVPADARFKDKYRLWKTAVSVIAWAAYLCAAGIASAAVFGVSAADVAQSYVLTFWFGSLLLHHSQLLEHGNLIRPGTWAERNRWTRNLRGTGLPAKIFLFLTHGDSHEHVLHHTATAIYSRPFPEKLPMPDDAVIVSMRDYLRVLKEMTVGKVP